MTVPLGPNCPIVRLFASRELAVSPEMIRGNQEGYRLSLRKKEGGRLIYTGGGLLLTRSELVAMVRGLEGFKNPRQAG